MPNAGEAEHQAGAFAPARNATRPRQVVPAKSLDALPADGFGSATRRLIAKHVGRMDQQFGIAGAAVT
jgi:hypothetical protein